MKTDLQCNCVETLIWFANGSMENLPKEQGTRIPLGKFKESCTHGGRKGAATPTSNIDNFVKHIFREHKQEADRWADIGAQGRRIIDIYRKDASTTLKYVVSGMEASKDDGSSGCGIVIKEVEKLVTISKIAVPLKMGAAIAAEVIRGVRANECPRSDPLRKSLSEQNINQRINKILPC